MARQFAYKSCEWIEGGLAFNRRSLHACLIVHHHRGWPFYSDYNGGPIPLEEVLRMRERIRSLHRNGETNPDCEGCTHLVEKPWLQNREYPFDILGIAQFSHCNIACNYCFLQTQERSSFESGFNPYSLYSTLENLFEQKLLSPNSIIDWGGGEPTVYRDIDRILAASLQRGARHYLHTNGIVFPSVLEENLNAKQVHVICSVDAGTRETYKLMKARDRLDQVWQSLRKYRRAGCAVSLKYIVRKENADNRDIEPFVDQLQALDIRHLILDIDYNQPEPDDRVIQGLAKLGCLAERSGIRVGFGFTGVRFREDDTIRERYEQAFQTELQKASG